MRGARLIRCFRRSLGRPLERFAEATAFYFGGFAVSAREVRRLLSKLAAVRSASKCVKSACESSAVLRVEMDNAAMTSPFTQPHRHGQAQQA